jgi:hypothetical protein
MKKLLFTLSIATLLIGACGGDSKPTPVEQQKVEEQVAKDQAAQDSMEAVIMEQIEAVGEDSITTP